MGGKKRVTYSAASRFLALLLSAAGDGAAALRCGVLALPLAAAAEAGGLRVAEAAEVVVLTGAGGRACAVAVAAYSVLKNDRFCALLTTTPPGECVRACASDGSGRTPCASAHAMACACACASVESRAA